MKKMTMVAIAVLVLTLGSVAHAATYTFQGMANTPLNGTPFDLTDSGVKATFSGFQWIDGTGILIDHEFMPLGGMATITFDQQMDFTSLVLDIIDTSQGFFIEYFSNGAPTKDAFDTIHFSLNPGALLGITAVTASPTPIPGAIWILGSGLVGLVGIRRKYRTV